MSEVGVVDLAPVTEADYETVRRYIVEQRLRWEKALAVGLVDVAAQLSAAGHVVLEGRRRAGVFSGAERLDQGEVALAGRVKQTGAIVAKMRRFGEPLRVMLDVLGFRVVTAGEEDLDAVAEHVGALWDEPAPDELLLRHGALQFDWWRDYRKRSHAGLSAATTDGYDQAIHMNRRAPFGMTEIQVLTCDLFRRVHCDPASGDSHDQFVARRAALFKNTGG